MLGRFVMALSLAASIAALAVPAAAVAAKPNVLVVMADRFIAGEVGRAAQAGAGAEELQGQGLRSLRRTCGGEPLVMPEEGLEPPTRGL